MSKPTEHQILEVFYSNILNKPEEQNQLLNAAIDQRKEMIQLLGMYVSGHENCLDMRHHQVTELANMAIVFINSVNKHLLEKYID